MHIALRSQLMAGLAFAGLGARMAGLHRGKTAASGKDGQRRQQFHQREE